MNVILNKKNSKKLFTNASVYVILILQTTKQRLGGQTNGKQKL